MTRLLSILLIPFLLTSCSILNGSVQTIKFYTTQPSRIIYNGDTLITQNNKAKLTVTRGSEPLHLIVQNDSLSKDIELFSHSSFAYWSNIYCNMGIGMLIDRNNPKRYSYQRKVYITRENVRGNYFLYTQKNNRGKILLNLSLPWVNAFHLVPAGETDKNNVGFWGGTIGIDYYHTPTQFISFNVTGAADLFAPVPAAIDISGEYDLMSTRYFSISNSHQFNWLTVGYGVSYGKNIWDHRYYDRFNPPPPTREPVKKENDALGIIFPVHFQTGEHFRIGFVYRPTFYRPGIPEPFVYEHLISIDFGWKIILKK